MSEIQQVYTRVVQNMIDAIIALDLSNEENYRHWVAQTFFYTSHSEDLLKYYAQCAENPDVKARWSAHAQEEHGHENLALADLKGLGRSPDLYQEYASTRELYQSQYAIAEQTQGIANFGWAIALEGLAAGIPETYVNKIMNRYDKTCTRFVKVHTQEDPEHIVKALEVAEKMPGKEAIINNIKLTGEIYIKILNDIAAEQKETVVEPC